MATVRVPAALVVGSVAVSFTASYLPAFEGRPVIAPVLLLMFRPGGRPVALHVSAGLAVVSVAVGLMSTATPVYTCVFAGAVTLTVPAVETAQMNDTEPFAPVESVAVTVA